MSAQDDKAGTHRIDTTKPHPARMYDYFLGGKDNYPVDEQLGNQLIALEPNAAVIARVNRAFMHRATRWLAEAGIRQFLDIGSGIPTEPNLHQIAQSVAPESRVVYCDHDPIVLAHAAALLHGSAEGELTYLQADARDTDAILEHAGKVLDFSKPVALSLIALLHFINDESGARELIGRLKSVLAPGSYLVLSHITSDFHPADVAQAADDKYKAGGLTLAMRTKEEFSSFFDGLDFVEPGVALAEKWHPEPGVLVPGQTEDLVSAMYAGVAHKP